jgi:hypothetical protein
MDCLGMGLPCRVRGGRKGANEGGDTYYCLAPNPDRLLALSMQYDGRPFDLLSAGQSFRSSPYSSFRFYPQAIYGHR